MEAGHSLGNHHGGIHSLRNPQQTGLTRVLFRLQTCTGMVALPEGSLESMFFFSEMVASARAVEVAERGSGRVMDGGPASDRHQVCMRSPATLNPVLL